jgi:ribose-phosphate pyrophosphokinase
VEQIVIISGSQANALAQQVASQLGIPHYPSTIRYFPDGELYLRLPTDVKGKKIILFESFARRPNDALVETVFLSETLHERGAGEVILVAPYLPYLRQDSEFNPGEIVSAKMLSTMLSKAGIDALVTVDPHLHRFKDLSELFKMKTLKVSAMPLLAEYFYNYHREALVVAPDEEAEQWAKLFSGKINAPYIVLEKHRFGDTEVEISGSIPKGTTAVIVDDIISTGGTIVEAAEKLKEHGFTSIHVCVTHALLVQDAEAKIFQAGVESLIATDTVINPYMRVSVAKIIGDALERLMSHVGNRA